MNNKEQLYICESAHKCNDFSCGSKVPHIKDVVCNVECSSGRLKSVKCVKYIPDTKVVESNWYSENTPPKGALDLSKPIMAKGNTSLGYYLLIPQLNSYKKDYTIIGYNWLNIQDGTYNSCVFFKTIEEAVNSRIKGNYKLFNYEFTQPTNLGE